MDPTESLRPLVIVKLGETLASLAETHGDFEQWIASGLGDTPLPIMVLDPRRGDTLPSPDSMCAAILTGSHAMVTDHEPWSESTARWLTEAVAAGVPVLGICYGHQLLAHAMGGQVGDRPKGLRVGTVPIERPPAADGDALFGELPPRFDGQVANRQCALRLPPGALPLAAHAEDPHMAFRVGHRAWGVQFHPEFDDVATRAYVDALATDAAPRDALRDTVRPTPQAAGLLSRFARLVAAREAPAVQDARQPAQATAHV